jgi:hypothetical protein
MIMTPPAKKKKNRNYKREYAIYHGKPEQIKRRAQRNAARRKMVKLGRAKKGDGMDVNHKNHRTSQNTLGNLEVIAKSKNRSMNKQHKRAK